MPSARVEAVRIPEVVAGLVLQRTSLRDLSPGFSSVVVAGTYRQRRLRVSATRLFSLTPGLRSSDPGYIRRDGYARTSEAVRQRSPGRYRSFLSPLQITEHLRVSLEAITENVGTDDVGILTDQPLLPNAVLRRILTARQFLDDPDSTDASPLVRECGEASTSVSWDCSFYCDFARASGGEESSQLIQMG